jgi:replicative DNA helicase
VARVADDVVQIPGHRIPPQDLDAERSVLGSMLLSTEAMADVVEILEPDDFFRSAHGKIYAALRLLFAHGEPIDVITAVDGKAITTVEELVAAVQAKKAGDTMALTVLRNGQEQTVNATLAARTAGGQGGSATPATPDCIAATARRCL